MPLFSDQQLLSACRILFGPDATLNRDFLWYLQPTGVKTAYRERAKQSHPDAHPQADAPMLEALQTQFNELNLAYKLLDSYLQQRGDGRQNRNHDFGAEFLQKQAVGTPGTFTERGNDRSDRLPGRSLPAVEIKTGRYLYLRGFTTFRSILDALSWQRSQRPTLGVMARQWGWLDDSSVVAILRATHISGKFGERAVNLGYLSTHQKEMLLTSQQSAQQLIGRYFIQRGIVSEAQLAVLLRDLQAHNRMINSFRCNSL